MPVVKTLVVLALSIGWGVIVLVNVGSFADGRVSPGWRDAIAISSGALAAIAAAWLFVA